MHVEAHLYLAVLLPQKHVVFKAPNSEGLPIFPGALLALTTAQVEHRYHYWLPRSLRNSPFHTEDVPGEGKQHHAAH